VRITIVTLFPAFFDSPLGVSIVGRAIATGLIDLDIVDLREHGLGPHRQVDDTPFGGGPGMVMMIEPLSAALRPLEASHRVLLTPGGDRLTQPHLDRWAETPHLTLVCGRFEGVDERVAEHLIDEQVSLGDFVIAGGEAGAVAIVEGVARLLPGVVGNPESTESESFRDGLLEEAQYTRPAEFQGWSVPEILLSGDHGKIAQWRHQQRLERTKRRRPDLTEEFVVTETDGYDPAAPDGRPRSSEGTPDEHA
jgi:tRNA (guanine37-N1)-methyltransferase